MSVHIIPSYLSVIFYLGKLKPTLITIQLVKVYRGAQGDSQVCVPQSRRFYLSMDFIILDMEGVDL